MSGRHAPLIWNAAQGASGPPTKLARASFQPGRQVLTRAEGHSINPSSACYTTRLLTPSSTSPLNLLERAMKSCNRILPHRKRARTTKMPSHGASGRLRKSASWLPSCRCMKRLSEQYWGNWRQRCHLQRSEICIHIILPHEVVDLKRFTTFLHRPRCCV